MNDDASQAQYGTATPTCVACLTGGSPHPMPNTGLALGWPIAFGVVLLAAGMVIRRRLDSRTHNPKGAP